MKRTEEQILLCVAALSVVLVAAHTHESSGFSTPLYTYLYTGHHGIIRTATNAAVGHRPTVAGRGVVG